MKFSPKGLAFVSSFEGASYEMYLDVAGVPTIGIGHTKAAGEPDPLKAGALSIEQVCEIFAKDMADVERQVMKVVGFAPTQTQFDALASFTFNLGQGALATLLRGRSPEDVGPAILRYNKARVHGELQVVNGLTRRREAEKAIFEQGIYPAKMLCTVFPVSEKKQPMYSHGKPVDLSSYFK